MCARELGPWEENRYSMQNLPIKHWIVLGLSTLLVVILASCTQPSEAEQHYDAGHELHKQGHLPEAIVEYDEAIRLAPQTAAAYVARGAAFIELGQLERAIEDNNEAIRLHPQDALAYFNRALAYDRLGQFERAVEDYNESIRLDPKDAETYSNRVYSVAEDGTLRGGRLFAELHGDGPGHPDGMKVDIEGNVYCTGPGGVWVFDPEGRHLGLIKTPEQCHNFTIGGEDLKAMFLACRTSIYRLTVNIPGIPVCPAI